MKYRLLTVAEEDVAAAAKFYEQQVARLGSDFLDEFEATMSLICRQPEAWRAVSPRHRRCQLRRFPFAVLFTVHQGLIVVSGVMDQRIDPGRQRERIRET